MRTSASSFLNAAHAVRANELCPFCSCTSSSLFLADSVPHPAMPYGVAGEEEDVEYEILHYKIKMIAMCLCCHCVYCA